MQSMKKLRVGIIGQGRSGKNIHADFLKNVPEKFTIAAVSDMIQERCDRSSEEFSCPGFTNYRDMLNDKSLELDFIVNASFSHQHVPITKEIMEAGFDVLCEKPLARTKAEVEELIAVSERTGKVLAVYQQSRFAPYYRQVSKVVSSGVLGPVRMVKIAFNGFSRRYDWQTLQSYNAGNLYNTGPHPMDQALGFIGRDIMPDVWCKMDVVNSAGDAEDFCKILLSYPGRPIIDLEICNNTHYSPFTYQVYGTYGSLTGTMEHIEWKYYIPEEAGTVTLQEAPLAKEDGSPTYCSEKIEYKEESWDVPESEKDLFNSMAGRFYNNLYDVLVNGAALAVTPEEVCQQIAVMEECHRQNPLPKKQS